MTGFLASVRSIEEARLVIDAADIIDLKNPSQGALGVLPHEVVEAVVRWVDGRRPVSATVGDLPMVPGMLSQAVAEMAATGVDIIKVGFFGCTGHLECIDELAGLTRRHRVVAVLFADQSPNFSLIGALANARFYGAMLDTADKASGCLCELLPHQEIGDFIRRSKNAGLHAGLAGGMSSRDIRMLCELEPDYLGFRTALCLDSRRTSSLDAPRVELIRDMLRKCNRLEKSMFIS